MSEQAEIQSVQISANAEEMGKKDYTIIVNGRKKIVKSRELYFEQIVKLAFDPVPTGPNVLFTVTYSNGPKENPAGTLLAGQRVLIKDEMIFNVVATDKS